MVFAKQAGQRASGTHLHVHPTKLGLLAQGATFGSYVGGYWGLELRFSRLHGLITKPSTQTLIFVFNFRKQYDKLVSSAQMNGKQGCSSLGLTLSFNFLSTCASADIHSSQLGPRPLATASGVCLSTQWGNLHTGELARRTGAHLVPFLSLSVLPTKMPFWYFSKSKTVLLRANQCRDRTKRRAQQYQQGSCVYQHST